MRILIAGGTGLIGKYLCDNFLKKENEVYVLTRKNINSNSKDKITYLTNLNSDINFDYIINLSGAKLSNRLWSNKFKKVILDSRLNSTNAIVEYIKTSAVKPKILISASGISFYGSSYEVTFTEDSNPINPGFLTQLCENWESSAKKAKNYGTSVAILRLGVVMANKGGMLKNLLPIFKLGMGTVIGNGRQWLSWIHIEDLVSAINFIIEKNLEGTFNVSSINPVQNIDFSSALAKAINRPLFLKLPQKIVKIIFGEMGKEILLSSQKIEPKALNDAGFKFKFLTIENAFENLLEK